MNGLGNLVPSQVACPRWCELEPGHGYERDVAGGLSRYHVRSHGRRLLAAISQDEHAASPTGPVALDPPAADLDCRATDTYTIPAEQLRAEAAALLAAADLLDALAREDTHT